MDRVIACYKSVLCEDDIVVGDDQSVSMDRCQRKIGDYDRSAIEEANRLAAQIGGISGCLSFGTDAIEVSTKDALSRGVAEGYLVIDEAAAETDALLTGAALAAAISNIEDVRVVVCADGSSDVYQKQTAARIAATLDWPFAANTVKASVEGDALVVVQKIADGLRTLRVQMPCVISVLPEIAEPPTPGMRDILAAKKKPVVTWSLADVGVTETTKVGNEAMRGYVMHRKNLIFDEGTADEQVAGLVESLKKEGVL